VLTPTRSLLQCSLAVLQQHRQSQLSDTEKPPEVFELLMLKRSWKWARRPHLLGTVPSGVQHRTVCCCSTPKRCGKA